MPKLRSAARNTRVLPQSFVHFDQLPDAAHVRLPTVAALNGVSGATVWRWVAAGRLPAPIKIGPNSTAWNVGALRRARG